MCSGAAVRYAVGADALAALPYRRVQASTTVANYWLRFPRRHGSLDRADGAPADLRRLFVRKSGGADQDAGFALLSRQLLQRLAEVLHFRVIELIGSDVKDPA
jgi:hypothetical protein